jgi:CPA1 family monovalent cation:H+ antiporter
VTDRLSGGAFWDTIEMLITGVAFGLIGLELREVVDSHVGVRDMLLPALAICGVIFGVRLAWMLLAGPLVRHFAGPERAERTSRNWREDLVLAWCGMRGLATIALVLALPANTPERDQLVLITFAIIVTTLVLPGLTLPWVVKRLHVTADSSLADAAIRRLSKRAAKASLNRLRELDVLDDLPAEVSEVLRRRQQGMLVMLAGDAAAQGEDADVKERLAERAEQMRKLDGVYAEMLAAARREVLIARIEPGTDPAAADEVLRQLDLRSVRLI